MSGFGTIAKIFITSKLSATEHDGEYDSKLLQPLLPTTPNAKNPEERQLYR